jgi:hypothetical protein
VAEPGHTVYKRHPPHLPLPNAPTASTTHGPFVAAIHVSEIE